jgi:hypothetical protein
MGTDGKCSGEAAHSDLHKLTRERAEQIYVRNGRIPGRDLDNWAQAEREVSNELQAHGQRHAVVIKVNGAQYVGEYTLESSGNYVPGEIDAGGPVAVRFDGNKMFVRRPNGEELETTVVKKIG